MKKSFFKKSFSFGHHNIKFSWAHLMLFILNCVKGLESIEGCAKSPSAQTVRDRLMLVSDWNTEFHSIMASIAGYVLRRFPRYMWFISIDETHTPFFGERKKLNNRLIRKKIGKCVFGYKDDVKGATGSFCYVVISICCAKIRIPLAIKMVKVGERYESWLYIELEKALKIAPKSMILADRGYGKAVWFFIVIEKTHARYVVRMPIRKKKSKNKIKAGKIHIQQWYGKESKEGKVLIDIYMAKDSQDREYFVASNMDGKKPSILLSYYMHRWDIENIFKAADRVEMKTSSRNPLMRLFCIVVSFLMLALWQVSRILGKSVRCSLRKFVKHILSKLCIIMGCTISEDGKIIQSA
jgi:hypothetical protein